MAHNADGDTQEALSQLSLAEFEYRDNFTIPLPDDRPGYMVTRARVASDGL